MRYLITGGCGFLGSNLACEVINRGEELYLFDNLSRSGSSVNLNWLKSQGYLEFIHGDIRNYNDVFTLFDKVKPDIVFHLAGQVAMTTSIKNPRYDFEVNTIGTHNLLESIRINSPNSLLIYSSTNKVYGNLENLKYREELSRYIAIDYPTGFTENLTLDLQSPYGCSKGAADQYVLDYARNYSIKSIVFRHSSIFGVRQYSTFDQGWIGWFIDYALKLKKRQGLRPISISGDGKQVRDILFSSDLIACYFAAINSADNAIGEAFNIGGGMENSLSLIELFNFLEDKLKIDFQYEKMPWRPNDQKVFVANTSKAFELLGWSPAISKASGIEEMIEWSLTK
jgi:CDP-paratose 2-epimerase